jgi:hypothetical protein
MTKEKKSKYWSSETAIWNVLNPITKMRIGLLIALRVMAPGFIGFQDRKHTDPLLQLLY